MGNGHKVQRNGGLGIGSLQSANMALLAKWVWRFRAENNSLWKKLILAIHQKKNSPWIQIPPKKDITGAWKNICKVSGDLTSLNLNPSVFMQVHIGIGDSTSFWHDPWIHDSPLRLVFPALYNMEEEKEATMAERVFQNVAPSLGDSCGPAQPNCK